MICKPICKTMKRIAFLKYLNLLSVLVFMIFNLQCKFRDRSSCMSNASLTVLVACLDNKDSAGNQMPYANELCLNAVSNYNDCK